MNPYEYQQLCHASHIHLHSILSALTQAGMCCVNLTVGVNIVRQQSPIFSVRLSRLKASHSRVFWGCQWAKTFSQLLLKRDFYCTPFPTWLNVFCWHKELFVAELLRCQRHVTSQQWCVDRSATRSSDCIKRLLQIRIVARVKALPGNNWYAAMQRHAHLLAL